MAGPGGARHGTSKHFAANPKWGPVNMMVPLSGLGYRVLDLGRSVSGTPGPQKDSVSESPYRTVDRDTPMPL